MALQFCECHAMADFIFNGQEASDKNAGLLAAKYEHGYRAEGGVLAMAIGMSWKEAAEDDEAVFEARSLPPPLPHC